MHLHMFLDIFLINTVHFYIFPIAFTSRLGTDTGKARCQSLFSKYFSHPENLFHTQDIFPNRRTRRNSSLFFALLQPSKTVLRRILGILLKVSARGNLTMQLKYHPSSILQTFHYLIYQSNRMP